MHIVSETATNYICTVHQLTMSITAVNLTDGIRVDRATQKRSVYDVIQQVTQGDPRYSARVLARLVEFHPELAPEMDENQDQWEGQKDPSGETLEKIAIMALSGSRKSMTEKGKILQHVMQAYIEEEIRARLFPNQANLSIKEAPVICRPRMPNCSSLDFDNHLHEDYHSHDVDLGHHQTSHA